MTKVEDFLSLWQFFSRCFVPYLNLSIPLKPFHKVICDTLQLAVTGQLFLPGQKDPVKFIVINMPPRVGKTKILEALSCWMIAYFPDLHSINCSYSATLATASTRYVKLILESSWYHTLFPWVEFGEIEKANEFETEHNGHVYGAGVGGTITGFGAGLKRPAGGFIAIDDPSNPSDALSATEAENIKFWFENTIVRRRNSSTYTPIIVVQQRLAPEDLSGHVLSQYPESTFHLKFPAEVNGESTIPETIDIGSILKLKQVNPFVYWAQLQQEPVALGGNLIKTNDFLVYDFDPDTVRWERKVLTCDTALKAAQHNDWSVIQIWGRLNNKTYLIDQCRGKWETPELVNNYRAMYLKHQKPDNAFSMVSVEDAAAGTGLGQLLRLEAIPIQPIVRNKDKVTRVKENLPWIATHMVCLPKHAPFLPELLSELAKFRADGKHDHDDQVDALCDGIELTLGRALSIFDVLG